MENINLDKELFKLAFENANIGMCLVDLKGKIFKVNYEMSNIFGYSVQELEQMNVNDITHPDYKNVSPQFIKQATQGELSHSVFEKHYLHKNGSEIICIVTSSAVKNEFNETQFFISHVQDITAQKQSEIDLKFAKEKAEEKETRYRLANKATNDVIWDWDIISDTQQWNEAGTKIFGWSEIVVQPVNARWWVDRVHPDDMVRVHNSFFAVVNNSDLNYWHDEYRFLKADGIYAIVYDRGYVHRNEQGKAIRMIGAMQDITEQKIKERELKAAKERAEESDRLKTAFLQNMSHEIRTPLNAISGFSGMLNKPELSEEKRKSFVSIIQNSSKQLVSIVTDILTISSLETKQEKANIDKVCINNIIVDLFAIFKQQAQIQNISIYVKQQLNDKQSEIYTDNTKITQILTNLLTNSLKFTHEGSIEFGYSLKNNEIEFYVKDSGIGVKPEFQEKIFERFSQADKSTNKLYGGTGLGLAISKAFVELLGGKIWVQSELEKGSTFYFTIPYKPVNETDKTITPTKQNENFRTVLVAEDEEYNFLFIEELLIGMDLKLIHAKDGRETVEIFNANPNIDLILMDIKMPIMTGHEAAKIIKELKPDMPIVAQSAYALEHERAKYEGIFDDYLTKPMNEVDLKQMVMKYIKNEKNK